ncbi:MAG TPA: tRNA (N(6)-L-threonylcarbamoyladenosine(37)-C(2))-methylthiotransferase [Nitrososphaeria archaeon]|nr:tRNA (N(6)-L-threonylcarbamoyladenosine(37)-C(2))-methylthiotransferase [Nitrososphaeria archaeon]
MKVYSETYGCAANMADSEIALGILRQAGYTLTRRPEDADAIIIFTCVVKKPTSDRMLYRINSLKRFGKKLVVAGCMVSGEPEKIRRAAPKAILVHPRAITRIVEAIESGKSIVSEDEVIKLRYPRVRRNPIIAIIPVSEGCWWRRCSFCIVARTRGRYMSYPLDMILEEVEDSLREGVKEIWLTSQDMGSYGIESGRSLLPKLIRCVSNIDGLFLVRIGMMNPIYLKPILEDLAEAYLRPRIFKFLHLPVQSGSNHVLRDMGRGYTVELFKEIVAFMRSRIKDLTLSTDIIVGYPTEDEEDFEKTIKLIEEIKPDMINLSRFFPRPGTPAEKLKPLDPRLVKKRSRLMSEVAKETALRAGERWIGWRGIALVDEIGEKGEAIARNLSYKPIVLDENGKKLFGKFVEVEVESARPYCLMGRVRRVLSLEEASSMIIKQSSS